LIQLCSVLMISLMNCLRKFEVSPVDSRVFAEKKNRRRRGDDGTWRETAYNAAAGAGNMAYNAAAGAGNLAYNAVVGAGNMASQAVDYAKTKANDMVDGAAKGALDAVGGPKKLATLASKVGAGAGAAALAGKDMGQGVVDAMKGQDKVDALTNKVVAGAKSGAINALSNPPSKEDRKAGEVVKTAVSGAVTALGGPAQVAKHVANAAIGAGTAMASEAVFGGGKDNKSSFTDRMKAAGTKGAIDGLGGKENVNKLATTAATGAADSVQQHMIDSSKTATAVSNVLGKTAGTAVATAKALGVKGTFKAAGNAILGAGRALRGGSSSSTPPATPPAKTAAPPAKAAPKKTFK